MTHASPGPARSVGVGRPADYPVARSALHEWHVARGARMEERDGWLVPIHYGSAEGVGRRVSGVGGKEESEGPLSSDTRHPTPDTLRGAVVALGERLGLGTIDLLGRELDALARRFGAENVPVGRASAATAEGFSGRWCRLTREQARLVIERGQRGGRFCPLIFANEREWEEGLRTPSTVPSYSCQFAKISGQPPPSLHAVDVSSGLTTLLVLGPRSPDLLARLIRLDLDPRVFTNQQLALTGAVGIPLQVLRWDRGPLLAYELTFGRDVAEYFADALTHAGDDLGLRLIGEEGQKTVMGDEI